MHKVRVIFIVCNQILNITKTFKCGCLLFMKLMIMCHLSISNIRFALCVKYKLIYYRPSLSGILITGFTWNLFNNFVDKMCWQTRICHYAFILWPSCEEHITRTICSGCMCAEAALFFYGTWSHDQLFIKPTDKVIVPFYNNLNRRSVFLYMHTNACYSKF
jgi:hypothetical protein